LWANLQAQGPEFGIRTRRLMKLMLQFLKDRKLIRTNPGKPSYTYEVGKKYVRRRDLERTHDELEASGGGGLLEPESQQQKAL